MITDNLYYEKIEKITQILLKHEENISAEYEKRFSHLKELATYICRNIKDSRDFLKIAEEDAFRYCDSVHFHKQLLSQNRQLVMRELNSLRSFDRAILCECIVDEWERMHNEHLMLEDILDVSGFDAGYISYVKNKYSDKAFESLSLCVDEAKVSYSKNFEGICEDIANGFSSYGILPISANNCEIETVSKLLSSYELKICAVCDIPSADETVTKYALVSNKLRAFFESENRHFSFTLLSDSSDTVEEICKLLDLYGLTICSIRAFPAISAGYNCHFKIKENKSNLSKLALYLTVFYPHFVIEGLYSEI